MTSSKTATMIAPTSGGTTARPSSAKYKPSTPERESTHGYLEVQHRVRDAILERGEAHGLVINHFVERLDVQAWRRCSEATCSTPCLPRAHNLRWITWPATDVRRNRALSGTASESAILVSVYRFSSLIDSLRKGFDECLCSQIGGPDRVCLVHDCSAASVIPSDGQGEAERQDQCHEPNQSALHDTQRFPDSFTPLTQVSAESDASRVHPSTTAKTTRTRTGVLSRKNTGTSEGRA